MPLATSKLVTAKITETVQVQLPAAVQLGGFVAALFKGNTAILSPVTVAEGSLEVQLGPITEPGTYHVEVVRVLASGEAAASPAASKEFVVPEDAPLPLMVMVTVPKTVVVTLADLAPATA